MRARLYDLAVYFVFALFVAFALYSVFAPPAPHEPERAVGATPDAPAHAPEEELAKASPALVPSVEARKYGDGFTPEQLRNCDVQTAKLVQAGLALKRRFLSGVLFDLGAGDLSLNCGTWTYLSFYTEQRMPPPAFFGAVGAAGATFIRARSVKIVDLAMRCQLQALKTSDGMSEVHFAEGAMFCDEGDETFNISVQPPDPPERTAKRAKPR